MNPKTHQFVLRPGGFDAFGDIVGALFKQDGLLSILADNAHGQKGNTGAGSYQHDQGRKDLAPLHNVAIKDAVFSFAAAVHSRTVDIIIIITIAAEVATVFLVR